MTSQSRTNDTIIIHKNKITLDEIIEMEELNNYISMSTNYNSIIANSFKNKINNYLNNMDYRGSLKNKKNFKKISNFQNEKKFTDPDVRDDIQIINEKPKKHSDINIVHRKILSNILTSKNFFKISEKNKKALNSSLNKTIAYEAIHQDNNKSINDF